MKFRLSLRLVRRLPAKEAAISLLHGLHYFHGIATAAALGVLAFILVSGDRVIPVDVLRWRVLLPLGCAYFACELFRQRFYVLPRERGIHWRAAFVRYAKWPYAALAVIDLLRRRRQEYAITMKVPRPRRGLATAPHLYAALVLLVAWIGGRFHGVEAGGAHVVAAVVVLVSLAVVASEAVWAPAPFSAGLARTVAQRLQI